MQRHRTITPCRLFLTAGETNRPALLVDSRSTIQTSSTRHQYTLTATHHTRVTVSCHTASCHTFPCRTESAICCYAVVTKSVRASAPSCATSPRLALARVTARAQLGSWFNSRRGSRRGSQLNSRGVFPELHKRVAARLSPSVITAAFTKLRGATAQLPR